MHIKYNFVFRFTHFLQIHMHVTFKKYIVISSHIKYNFFFTLIHFLQLQMHVKFKNNINRHINYNFVFP